MQLLAEGLSRTFASRRVFGPLTFRVEPGQVLGVAGANGSGKTTLLRTLAGLLRPSTGSVRLTGADGSSCTPREAPDRIGWAAPDLALYGELTAAENLEFFSRVAGLPHADDIVEGHLRRVGLDPDRVRHAAARALSTGQRQRLKLAFATLRPPRILFLDEPGSNLDEAGHAVVASVVAAQRLVGLTVLASNDPRDLALTDTTLTL